MRILFCTAMAIVLAAPAVRAEEQPGGIDWQRRVIRTKGQAAPNQNAPNVAAARLGAEKAAKMDAQRNILETLKGVQITGAKTAADALTDPGVSSRVAGIIKGFKVVDTRYFSDGGVEVDVEMPLDGLVEALVPGAGGKAEAAPGKGATGLVVDARELDFVPALAPRVLDEAGAEIYGPGTADRTQARHGLAGYTRELQAATSDVRVGGSPVVVKALRLAGNPSEVVVSVEDGRRAREAFLAAGNVVFVTR